jgi:hypothetical protein
MEAASDSQADGTARPEAPKVGTKIRAPVALEATKREASYGGSKENEINGKPTEIWEGGRRETRALFSSEKWKVFGTVALSFVCDKYYPIID